MLTTRIAPIAMSRNWSDVHPLQMTLPPHGPTPAEVERASFVPLDLVQDDGPIEGGEMV